MEKLVCCTNKTTSVECSPSLISTSGVIGKFKLVQTRALKIPESLENLSYSERLGKLNLTLLKDRPLREDLIEIFKEKNGL